MAELLALARHIRHINAQRRRQIALMFLFLSQDFANIFGDRVFLHRFALAKALGRREW